MFNFIGLVMVLQPDASHSFVVGEGYHPMLPPVPGLYLLRQPSAMQAAREEAHRDAAAVATAVKECSNVVPTGEAVH